MTRPRIILAVLIGLIIVTWLAVGTAVELRDPACPPTVGCE